MSSFRRHQPLRIGRASLALIGYVVAASSGCGSCSTRPSELSPTRGAADTEQDARSSPHSPPSQVDQTRDGSVSAWSLLLGEEDSSNRYPFTVSLVAHAPEGQPKYRECAGVLVAPLLVLTAGHCVCMPHTALRAGSGRTIEIDTSACAATATVATYTYAPPTEELDLESWSARYQGEVHPHPQFQILIDAKGDLVTSHADLAVVRLKKPVQRNILPIQLAEEEVQPGELLTVVGYGYSEETGGMSLMRRFSQERALKFLAPDGTRVLFGSLELHTYKGDTGGPCLRETAQGPELLGISSRGLGHEPAFTLTSRYRAWLEEEIRLAMKRGSAPPQAPPSRENSSP
jgi:hypothetical protein